MVRNDKGYNQSNNGVIIDNCVFLNNSCLTRNNRLDAIATGTFPGRGGALAVLINSTFNFDVTITNSIVQDSQALYFGGGVILSLSGYSSHVVTIKNTQFINNVCFSTGGALVVGYLERSDSEEIRRMEIHDSLFDSNRADFGGGFFLYVDSEWYIMAIT